MKEPHTTIFTGPMGCGKTHPVLDLIEKNTTNILTILSPSAQYFNGIRHIILKTGSKMMIRFGLQNLRTGYFSGLKSCHNF